MKHPIFDFKTQIVNTVMENQVTIVVAETGAGKSTQIPQYMLERGYKVIITQPRRLAAISLAERVSDEQNMPIGTLIGYHTGYERKYSKDTNCTFCTDGLLLVKQLGGFAKSEQTILIIDEVHEWTLAMEVLVANLKRELQSNPNTKAIIVSATLESDMLSTFFNNAPIIKVSGRSFNVDTFIRKEGELISTIREVAQNGKNTLVFLPGKKEINEVKMALEKDGEGLEAKILILHSEISSEEQMLCFESYQIPKIILATNVAQTSITVPDIDVVIDSGFENRIEIEDNVERLCKKDISQSDIKQRKGRTGRTKPGEYYLCSNSTIESRPEFSTPEIQWLNLAQVILRLTKMGIKVKDIEFFHQPDSKQIESAYERLNYLGMMKNEEITPDGEKVAMLPTSIEAGKMLIEAIRRNVFEEVAIIVAIYEIGFLLDKQCEYSEFTSEEGSDLLAELDVYSYILKGMRKKVPNLFAKINKRNFYKIKELKEKITHDVQRLSASDDFFNVGKSTHDREQILISIFYGMIENIWYSFKPKNSLFYQYYKNMRNIMGKMGDLVRGSCIFSIDWSQEEKFYYIIAKPFTKESKTVLTMATVVKPEWLDLIPNVKWRVEEIKAKYYE